MKKLAAVALLALVLAACDAQTTVVASCAPSHDHVYRLTVRNTSTPTSPKTVVIDSASVSPAGSPVNVAAAGLVGQTITQGNTLSTLDVTDNANPTITFNVVYHSTDDPGTPQYDQSQNGASCP